MLRAPGTRSIEVSEPRATVFSCKKSNSFRIMGKLRKFKANGSFRAAEQEPVNPEGRELSLACMICFQRCFKWEGLAFTQMCQFLQICINIFYKISLSPLNLAFEFLLGSRSLDLSPTTHHPCSSAKTAGLA